MARIIYAKATVEYIGRSRSVLEPGRYLILLKDDSSISVHGGDAVKARNYLSKAKVEYRADGNRLRITATGKHESLRIEVHEILDEICPLDWSVAKIDLSGTERELTELVVAHHEKLFGFRAKEVHREFRTAHGPIDLMLLDQGDRRHFVEVKKRATMNGCAQLGRYLRGEEAARGWMAAMSWTASVPRWCAESGYGLVDLSAMPP